MQIEPDVKEFVRRDEVVAENPKRRLRVEGRRTGDLQGRVSTRFVDPRVFFFDALVLGDVDLAQVADAVVLQDVVDLRFLGNTSDFITSETKQTRQKDLFNKITRLGFPLQICSRTLRLR